MQLNLVTSSISQPSSDLLNILHPGNWPKGWRLLFHVPLSTTVLNYCWLKIRKVQINTCFVSLFLEMRQRVNENPSTRVQSATIVLWVHGLSRSHHLTLWLMTASWHDSKRIFKSSFTESHLTDPITHLCKVCNGIFWIFLIVKYKIKFPIFFHF